MSRTTPFNIILLHGSKQCGKSSVALKLVQDHAYDTDSFARILKEVCVLLLTAIGCRISMEFFEDGAMKESVVVDVDGIPFDFNRGGKHIQMTYRQVLQYVGTELFRNQFHRDIWAMSVQKSIRDSMANPYRRGIVIPDMRFPNEYEVTEEFIRKFGGAVNLTTVFIQRSGLSNNDGHDSENSMREFVFDVAINNNGSLAELFVKADKLATGKWQQEKFAAEIAVRASTNPFDPPSQ